MQRYNLNCSSFTGRWFLVSRKSVLGLSLMLLLGITVGCQTTSNYATSQISFGGLCGIALERFEDTNKEQVREWLEEQYGVNPQSSNVEEGVIAIRAEERNKGSTTAYLRQLRLIEIMREVKNGPTFGQVVTVFGVPDSVYGQAIGHERIPYSVGLDYPKRGVSVFMSKIADPSEVVHGNRLEVQLKESYTVNIVQCFAPHPSMDEVLRTGYLSSNPATIQNNLNRRKPWQEFETWVPLEP